MSGSDRSIWRNGFIINEKMIIEFLVHVMKIHVKRFNETIGFRYVARVDAILGLRQQDCENQDGIQLQLPASNWRESFEDGYDCRFGLLSTA